ncbi:MAG: ester cyclase [Anaerolineae bacterium]|nr:ester cyclase [Anaerolineae bacterium]
MVDRDQTSQLLTLANNLINAWNTHNIEGLVSFYAPNYEGVDVGQPEKVRGTEAARQSLNRYLQAFPDIHFIAEDILIRGSTIALVWQAQGTHQGVLMHIPPTGRKVTVRGVSLLTIHNSLIVKASYIWDVAGLLRGIGLLPEL